MNELHGQVAIVTGASRGIGKAIAEQLAAKGAGIAVISTTSAGSEAVAAELCRLRPDCAKGYALDVANYQAVETCCKQIVSDFGRIDILVNNAGITRDNLLMRMREEDWDQVLAVNLKGVYNCVKAVTRPMMKAHYGRIVTISSIIGITGNVGQANYAAAKAGVIGFSKSMAKELASRNITVNVVAPGFIDTAMTAELSPEQRDALLKQIPLGRTGKVEDIAAAVAFFVSSGADYVTGQVLCVDGGLVM
ncbi:MAG: 3-oxoacyl-ACP reductase FabG [Lentisphaerae bacterium]|jgi:3-oxoacyl-[acyl-carrier protein] reductase|nr:3-oxoacyl-ACP reductase FabG [Lentisphaerota bacterium]